MTSDIMAATEILDLAGRMGVIVALARPGQDHDQSDSRTPAGADEAAAGPQA